MAECFAFCTKCKQFDTCVFAVLFFFCCSWFLLYSLNLYLCTLSLWRSTIMRDINDWQKNGSNQTDGFEELDSKRGGKFVVLLVIFIFLFFVCFEQTRSFHLQHLICCCTLITFHIYSKWLFGCFCWCFFFFLLQKTTFHPLITWQTVLNEIIIGEINRKTRIHIQNENWIVMAFSPWNVLYFIHFISKSDDFWHFFLRIMSNSADSSIFLLWFRYYYNDNPYCDVLLTSRKKITYWIVDEYELNENWMTWKCTFLNSLIASSLLVCQQRNGK